MKFRILVSIIILSLILGTFSNISALSIKETKLDIDAKSAVLMDVNTGTLLFSKNMNESLPPASVTKIMTLLLVFEALDKQLLDLDEMVTVSENAASMGGSQVFLEPGESMSVDELIKCVTVASANDAALTLAERIGGSEEVFVEMMNKRADELGMKNTNFENVTGLDDDVVNHKTSAYDIALMSKELLKHEDIIKYTTIWTDSIRNGQFGLSNTNRLVRFYRGITGLKTGYTREAGYCISASAKRGDLHLVAVIMGADSSNERNAAAAKLLDFGFSNYAMINETEKELDKINVIRGEKEYVRIGYSQISILENKENEKSIEKEIVLKNDICAPINVNDVLGKVLYKVNGKIIAENQIISLETVEEITFLDYFIKVAKKFMFN